MAPEQHLDRLTSIDAAFLEQEKEGAHMHIGAVTIFEGDPPALPELAEQIAGRLYLIPRYRQKLAFPPYRSGRPLWVDDTAFNIDYHVRFTGLPEPGGMEQLKLLTGRIFSQRLDRGKPLWEIWLVGNLSRNRFALINKTHHALVDGVSGADITTVLFDLEPEPDVDPTAEADWAPGPEPTDADLLARGLEDLAAAPLRVVRRGLRAAADPVDSIDSLRRTAEGTGEIVRDALSGAPSTPFNRPIGAHRRVTWVDADLAELKAVKNALGGTVNDVFLAAVSGALRVWLQSHGERTDGLELRGAVPISVRRSDEHDELGNKLTLMVARLPTDVADPAERLRVVSERMERLKDSKQAIVAEAIGRLEDFAPPDVIAFSSRVHFSTRLYNLLVSNVAGPQFPLCLQGRRMREMIPIAFLAPKHALAIAILSYDGGVKIGLMGDFDAMPDLDELGDAIAEQLAALAAAALDRSPAGAR